MLFIFNHFCTLLAQFYQYCFIYYLQKLMLNITKGITKRLAYLFSYKKALINTSPQVYENNREALKQNIWRVPDNTSKKSYETHLSNGQYLIKKVPVIQSDNDVVRCIGGTQSGAGHPQVYIQLNTRHAGQPVSCKWCGLRYALRHHH